MSPFTDRLAEYRAHVAAAAQEARPQSLDMVYELGRALVQEGSDLLVVVRLHDQATRDALAAAGGSEAAARMLERLAKLRLHLLTPAAMAVAGYRPMAEQLRLEAGERRGIEEELRAAAFALAR